MKYLFASLLLATLVGCSASETNPPVVTPEPKPLELSEVAEQVSELYQNIDTAFDQSFETGIDFVIANNYPGAFDPVALQTCAEAKLPYLGDNITGGVPRVETLTLIPNWVGENTGAADWLLGGKTITGNVYRFDLEIDLEIIPAEIVEEDGQVFLLYGWCDAKQN